MVLFDALVEDAPLGEAFELDCFQILDKTVLLDLHHLLQLLFLLLKHSHSVLHFKGNFLDHLIHYEILLLNSKLFVLGMDLIQ